MTWCLLIFVANIQTPGLCGSRLDEGYLPPDFCERKNEKKLQTFLQGAQKQKYCITAVLQVGRTNGLTTLKGQKYRFPRLTASGIHRSKPVCREWSEIQIRFLPTGQLRNQLPCNRTQRHTEHGMLCDHDQIVKLLHP